MNRYPTSEHLALTVKDNVDLERRKLLALAGAVASASLLPPGLLSAQPLDENHVPTTVAPPTTMPAGYNILLVTVDQERYFEGGYPFPVPGRERLMREGTTFTHHENNSNVCTSSRSVMYTGWHMPQTGMFDNLGLPWTEGLSLDPKLGTLGSLLSDAGYYSAYKGKWHLNSLIERPGSVEDLGLLPTAKLHQTMERYGFKDYHGIGDMIGLAQGGYMFDPITTGQSINWLRSTGEQLRQANKPWFLAVNLVNPHDVMFIDTDQPGEPKQWHGKLVDGSVGLLPAQPPAHELYRARWDKVPLPASRHQALNEVGRPPAHLEYQQARATMVGQFPDDDRRWRKLQDYYFNCIRDCDTHLVSILDELDALGISDRTIVVFTADHGELNGYHQMHGKGSSVYRQQMHVPFIVRHPAYPGGKQCAAMTCHLDLAPTLLGLTGLPAARCAELLGTRKGKNASALLAAPEEAAPHALRDASLYCYSMMLYTDANYLAQVQEILRRSDLSDEGKRDASAKVKLDLSKRSAIRCINDGRYKFARYFSLRQHNTPMTLEQLVSLNDLELFDLLQDPEEMHNLATDLQQYGKLVMAMNEKLNALIAEEIGQDDGSYLPMSGFTSWKAHQAIE